MGIVLWEHNLHEQVVLAIPARRMIQGKSCMRCANSLDGSKVYIEHC